MMIKRLTAWLLLLAGTQSIFAIDVMQPLERAEYAQSALSYQGYISYQDLSEKSFFQITKDGSAEEKKLLVELVGIRNKGEQIPAEFTLTKIAEQIACSLTDIQSCLNYHDLFHLDFEKIRTSYLARPAVGRNIAGISSVCHRLIPKSRDRFHATVCQDRSTGLVLMFELISPRDRKVIKKLVFDWIEYNPEMDSELFSQAPDSYLKGTKRELLEEWNMANQNGQLAILDWLPEGFAPDEAYLGDSVQIYSDGLTELTVFVKQVAAQSKPEFFRRGLVTVASKTIERQSGHYKIIIGGEVSPRTVRKVIDNSRLR